MTGMNVEQDDGGVLEKRNIVSRIPVGYAEHAPPPDLAGHVVCFWTRVAEAAGSANGSRVHRVLPDGCVDIVLEFGASDPSGRSDVLEVRNAMGVGTMTRPLVITGAMPELYIGVRFRPGYALSALGVPASELTDESTAYANLAEDPDADLDALSRLRSNEERFDAVVALVRRRLSSAASVPLSVRAAIQRITVASGNLRVASVADAIGITRQQLARQFATHVGVAPKTFARVMRAQAALARADAARAAYPREIDWSAIACDLGYYDQPHFIDDFKALTGMTPSRWTR
jgi:AraC-like DNA-binding protein